MDNVRVAVVDTSEDFLNIFIPLLKNEPGIEVVGIAKDGATAMKMLTNVRTELLIIDNILGGFDGLDLLRRLFQLVTVQPPVVLLISSFMNDVVARDAANLGVKFIFKKPVIPEHILERVRNYRDSGTFSVVERQMERPKMTMLREVTDILLKCRVAPYLKGYAMVREAIMCVIEEPKLLEAVTKQLYPKVAARFNSTMQQTERNIRHAIKNAWELCGEDVRTEYFCYSNGECPTNSGFIAAIADRALLSIPESGRLN